MSTRHPKHARAALVLHSQQYFEAGFPLFINEVEQHTIHAHAHDFFEMVYVRRGRGDHVIGRQKYAVRAGDLFIIHPGEKHSYLPEANTTLQIVNILWQPELVREVLSVQQKASKQRKSELSLSESLPYIEPLFKARSRFHHHLHLSGSTAFRVEILIDEMRREIESARHGQAAPGCRALLRHLFCALLVQLSRIQYGQSTSAKRPSHGAALASSRASQQDAVARAIALLEARQQEQLRIEDVAAHVALSPSRLSHLFKQQTGRSIIAYLNEMRIQKACAALRDPTQANYPIHQIAADTGFSDLRFFHRVFHRHCGCSPLQWRKQNAV